MKKKKRGKCVRPLTLLHSPSSSHVVSSQHINEEMDRIKNEKRDDDGNVRVWWWPCVSVTLRRFFWPGQKKRGKKMLCG